MTPASAEALNAALQRADEAFAAKKLDEAASLYARDRATSRRRCGRCWGSRAPQTQRGEPQRSLETLRRALVLAPNSEEVLSAYARVALAARAPVTAILTLEPLARVLPSVMEYHYLLGVALMQAGDMPSAVFALQDALALEPNRAVTLVALGLAFNSQKLYAEARAAAPAQPRDRARQPRGPGGARRVGGRHRRARVGRDATRSACSRASPGTRSPTW